jgi:hypothetical protein
VAEKSQIAQSTGSESPFAPGSCKCGAPGCHGHKVEADGMLHIRNHPGGHIIIDPTKLPKP